MFQNLKTPVFAKIALTMVIRFGKKPEIGTHIVLLMPNGNAHDPSQTACHPGFPSDS